MKTVLFASMFALSLAFVPALMDGASDGPMQTSRAHLAEGESLQIGRTEVAEGEALQPGATQIAEGESLQIGRAEVADARGSEAFDRMFIRSGEFSVVTIL